MARGKFKALREEPGYDEEVDGEYDEEGEYEQDADAEYEDDDEDEYEQDADAEYEEDEEDQDVQAEYAEDDEAEYDDDSEDEYEEDEYYDDDEAEYEEEEPYRPPTALAAIKDAFTGKGRPKARPASGTDEDAQRVNYVTTRERALGFFLGFALIALGILVYFSDRDATRATLKYPTKGKLTTAQQANLATIHSAAGKDLIVYAALGVLIVTATFWKRRAAIAFTALFAGLALFFTGDILGILYLGVGGWMIMKVRKQTRETNLARAAGSTRTPLTRPPTGRRSVSPRPSTSSTSTSSTAASTGTSGQRQIGKNNRQYASGGGPAAPPSKRYTPPKQVRRPVPSVQPEPEPPNRLSAWLRK